MSFGADLAEGTGVEVSVRRGGALSGLEAMAPRTVLIIDDDDRVRAVVEKSLLRAHYRVLAAGNGPQALAAVESHRGPIHLIISDVVLAGRGGPEVVAAVQERAKTARVLFMSGHAHEGLVEEGLLPAGVPFIQKPFGPGALTRKVHDVLHG